MITIRSGRQNIASNSHGAFSRPATARSTSAKANHSAALANTSTSEIGVARNRAIWSRR